MADVAVLPKAAPERPTLVWRIRFATDAGGYARPDEVFAGALVSADLGWIKFQCGAGELRLYPTQAIASAATEPRIGGPL